MRRIAITGLGLVTPLGRGVGHVWGRLTNGESGIRAIQAFDVSDLPCKIAGTVPIGEHGDGHFDPESVVTAKERRKVDDFERMSGGRSLFRCDDLEALRVQVDVLLGDQK